MREVPASPDAFASDRPLRSVAVNTKLLVTLAVLSAYNFLDRIAWSLNLQSIKTDLALSDAQLGLLSGIAFTLFYALAGIPLARLADRGYRVLVIATTTAFSGAMIALSGAAQSFALLLVARIGVALGDAGCTPAAQSLIATHVERGGRPRANALFFAGLSLSGLVGAPLAGALNEAWGWRATFVAIGLPGLVLGWLGWFVLRRFERPVAERSDCEQSDQGASAVTPDHVTAPTYSEVFRQLWSIRTYRHLLYGYVVIGLAGSGLFQWEAVFFVRTHSIGTAELGLWMSGFAAMGLLATYGSGELATRFAATNEALQLRAVSLAMMIYGASAVGMLMAANHQIAFASRGLLTLCAAAMVGPYFAVVQSTVPANLRATSVALIHLTTNLISMGVGPLVVGALSDTLQPEMGAESLRYALLAMCPAFVWAATHVWQASRSVMDDLVMSLPEEHSRSLAKA